MGNEIPDGRHRRDVRYAGKETSDANSTFNAAASTTMRDGTIVR